MQKKRGPKPRSEKRFSEYTQPELVKFVELWEAGKDRTEVAEAFGVTAERASAIAAMLRKHKVKLKKFTRKANVDKVDWTALRKLVRVGANGVG